MFDAETEDSLKWLADRYSVTIGRNPANGKWTLDLGSCEMTDASFDGTDLASLIAAARQWEEAPTAERLDGSDWLRLCAAAARQGKPVRDLIRQGTREMLDRIDSEQDSSR